MKLAFIALVVGIGTGACVAEDPTVDRLGTEAVTDFSVANEAEQGRDEGTNGNLDLVVITGVEIPGRAPTNEHIDISNVDTAQIDPQVRELCVQADQLPGSDVCSQICNTGFAAKLFDQGNAGGCTQHQCSLPGDITVSLDVCVGS